MKKRPTFYLAVLTLTIVASMISWSGKAQGINYKVHALFLYKFTQYIEWPAANGNYVIGVVGNSPILEELQNIAASKKNVTIKKLSPTSDLSGCQLIFVSEGSSAHLGTVSSKVNGKPVLVISETGSGAKKGAGINFIMVDDRMKFELNKANVERQGLKVSGDLVTLSILVG
ncbi:MAG TPA: YfiR family protein [Cytophagaceae bacterium]|nr:YfiR family protein [Cytophagaceae bacterium]